MSLYDDLGVSKDASNDEIKKAFRKKARKTHPDKTGGNSEDFHKIHSAYLVLIDEHRRKQYDETGDTHQRPKESIQATATRDLAAVFQQVVLAHLDKISATNINYEIQKTLDKAERDINNAIRETDNRSAKIKLAMDRLSHPDGENSALHYTLKTHIDAGERRVEKLNGDLKIVAAMRDLWASYSYNHEALNGNYFITTSTL